MRDRDRSADGAFVYAVATTGVYCRPSCASRLPRPENVRFYDSADEAERAGFRACKRCKPEDANAAQQTPARVAELCRLIEESATAPRLEQLASHVGLSAFHTHRLFKAATGLTPRAYAAAERGKRVRAELETQGSVTGAIYRAGYGSAGRFYAESPRLLGMTPTQYRSGGADQAIRFALGRCSLGALLVAATDVGVCAISIGDEPKALRDDLERRFPRAELVAADPAFEQLVAHVVALVEAPGQQPEARSRLPLDIRGTAFQRRVWQALTAIPAGTTRSYTELARAVGAEHAVRAVAGACAANALAVAIPCHRVVRSDGSLSGYRWGVERKRELLRREAADQRAAPVAGSPPHNQAKRARSGAPDEPSRKRSAMPSSKGTS